MLGYFLHLVQLLRTWFTWFTQFTLFHLIHPIRLVRVSRLYSTQALLSVSWHLVQFIQILLTNCHWWVFLCSHFRLSQLGNLTDCKCIWAMHIKCYLFRDRSCENPNNTNFPEKKIHNLCPSPVQSFLKTLLSETASTIYLSWRSYDQAGGLLSQGFLAQSAWPPFVASWLLRKTPI